MIEIAKKLSEDFPFVRVDLYVYHDNPIFGELTFSPYHEQTKESLIELGDAFELKNIDEYKSILSKTV